jgi:hypothetical protein
MIQDVLVKLNPGFPWERWHSRRRRTRTRSLFSPAKLELHLRKKKKKVKCFISIVAVYGAETQTL